MKDADKMAMELGYMALKDLNIITVKGKDGKKQIGFFINLEGVEGIWKNLSQDIIKRSKEVERMTIHED